MKMNKEIAERIQMIKEGKIPEGYIKTESEIIPSDWEYTVLGKKLRIFRGASPRPKGDPRYYGGAIPRLMIQDVTRDGKYTYPCIDSLTKKRIRSFKTTKERLNAAAPNRNSKSIIYGGNTKWQRGI